MIKYELILFKQKGLPSGNGHYDRLRFDGYSNAQEYFARRLPVHWHYYTITRLELAKGKVVKAELLECR